MYVTLVEVKRWLSSTTTASDQLLTEAILDAQAIIESDAGTGRVYEVGADTTRTFDAVRDVCGAVLELNTDLCQVTTVTNGDGATLSASTYVLERWQRRGQPPYRQVRLKSFSGGVWMYGANGPEDAIAITGRWGYSITAPERIQRLARDIAMYLYRGRSATGDAATDRPLLTGDGVVMLARSLPRDLTTALRAERLMT